MKNKKLKILLWFGLTLAVFFTACDMVLIDDHVPASQTPGQDDPNLGGKELTTEEKIELEKTGRFLKLVNMPSNTQTTNVSSVSVANSLSVIGQLNKNEFIMIYREVGSCTVYLPLVYNNGDDFLETGSFYTAFTVHVDAFTKYVINISNRFVVYYTDGRGQIDVDNLPSSFIVQDSGGIDVRELTKLELDELERTAHFLKLVNMPPNTQTHNVFSVSVANSSSSVGKLANAPISIYRETGSCSVYLPLVYNDDNDFMETGYFFTTFTIHVDAVTKYVVSVSDHILVYFTEGRGQIDVNDLPAAAIVMGYSRELLEKERDDLEKTEHFLKLVNMPPNTQIYNVSSVSVENSSSSVGKLNQKSAVFIYRETDSCTVYLPLVYNNGNDFIETGSFYVAFTIHVDAVTKYVVNVSDHVLVYFTEGRGQADVNDLPFVNNIPCLSITGLPVNVTKFHFSNISVNNMSGTVAGCSNNDDITVVKYSSYSSATIPLAGNNDDYFRDTGVFTVSFTVNVDALTRIVFTQSDKLMLDFFKGSASFDLNSTLGFFAAELANPSDADAPVIKKGSSFELNGSIQKINSNIIINSLLPSRSGFVYVYAYRNENDVLFEYSPVAPAYNNSKKGYYNGNKRALFKMFLLVARPSDSAENQHLFFAKKYVGDEFAHLGNFVVDDRSFFASFSESDPVYTLSGDANPPPDSVTLEPGIYLIRLVGAGGGSSSDLPTQDRLSLSMTHLSGVGTPSNNRSHTFNKYYSPEGYYGSGAYYAYLPLADSVQGGDGGSVIELLFVNSATSFTAFTGSGGSAASVSPNGLVSGGGGGGSGTFLFSRQGYLLCAGGGAGAPGISSFAPGGGGGAGGSVGSGGGGGGSGYLTESVGIYQTHFGGFELNSTIPKYYITTESSVTNYFYSYGGSGGGYQGGSGGRESGNGVNGASCLPMWPDYYFITNLSYYGTSMPYSASLNYTQTLNRVPGEAMAMVWVDGVEYNPIGRYYEELFEQGSYGASSSGPGGAAHYLNYLQIYNTGNSNGLPETTPALPSLPLLKCGESSYTYNFSYAEKTGQRDGGNNRNSLRGGGADGGSKLYPYPVPSDPLNYKRTVSKGGAGSIVIYKIQ